MRNVKADFRRYRRIHGLVHTLFDQSWWAILEFRIGHWVRKGERVPFRPVLQVMTLLTRKVIEVGAGISISPVATIGPGFHIAHFGGIFINSDAVIGSDCSISQGVTIGNDPSGGVPVLGDRVSVYPGATMFGAITIGDDAKIGAGAVVLNDVPPGATAVGPKARVVERR